MDSTSPDVCSKGHPWTPENTIRRRNGARRCRTCTQAYERDYKKRTTGDQAYRDTGYRANRLRVLRESPPYCAICGGYVDTGISGRLPLGPSVDHIIPVSHGGTHSIDNLRLVHAQCNSIRQNRLSPVHKPKSTRSW